MNTPPKVGDRVGVNHPKHPGTWEIKKINPVNLLLERVEGGPPARLRCPESLLTDPPVPGAVPGSTVQTLPVLEMFDVGELVQIKVGKYAGLYAVIKDNGDDKVNIAKLGGDGGAYVRALRGSISKISLDEIKMVLDNQGGNK